MNKFYPHIFTPLTVGKVVFKNRVFTAPSTSHLLQNNAPKYPEPSYIRNYLEKAKGGAACVNCGGMQVFSDGPNPIHSDFDISDPCGWRNYIHLSNAIHFYDARCSFELIHFGTEGEYSEELKKTTLYGPSDFVRKDGVVFHEMPVPEMERVAEKYAELAAHIKFCGFDGVLIHGGHGTLLQEFVSPRSNHRVDEFGGSLENRARFPLMVLDAIRSRVGRELFIEYRISGSEFIPGGFEIEECAAFTKLIQDRIDIIHVSAGVVREPRLRAITHPTGFLPPACNAFLAERVKADPEVRIPVLTLGAFQDPALIEKTLAEGRADLVAMARGTIADPHTVEKARNGRPEDIVPCIKCFHCLDEFKDTHCYSCAVNPTAGREAYLEMLLPEKYDRKKVAVVGGGPAGMKAAVLAAERGHSVTLFERERRLGGQLKDAAFMSFKYDLKNYEDYLVRQTGKSRIDVRLGVEATPEMIAAGNFDSLIVAIGADPLILPIPGIDGKNVIWAGDSFFAPERVGTKLVIIGGGQVGCETGVHYGMQGRDVTILEMLPQLARDAMRTYREELVGQVGDHCKQVLLGAKCSRITEEGVYYTDGEGAEHFVPGDTVILAMGMRPRFAQAEAFRDCCEGFRKIGDCDRVGNVKKATRAAYDAAMTL